MWPEALTWPPHLLQNYLPSQEGMAYNQFIKMMVIFSIAFITVLILKVSGTCSVPLGGAVKRGWGVVRGGGGETVWRQGGKLSYSSLGWSDQGTESSSGPSP